MLLLQGSHFVKQKGCGVTRGLDRRPIFGYSCPQSTAQLHSRLQLSCFCRPYPPADCAILHRAPGAIQLTHLNPLSNLAPIALHSSPLSPYGAKLRLIQRWIVLLLPELPNARVGVPWSRGRLSGILSVSPPCCPPGAIFKPQGATIGLYFRRLAVSTRPESCICLATARVL